MDKTKHTISIVSHGHAALLRLLLNDLQDYCGSDDEIILTFNINEDFDLADFSFRCPVRVIENTSPLGFGANHNKAFSLAKGDFFCVLNPDIRLFCNPFPELVAALQDDIGLVAPRVVNPAGVIEKSARRFPTPFSILKKALGREEEDWTPDSGSPDWVAGMFMIFPAQVFRELRGFDERYFLYYEDVDICARLRVAGYTLRYCPEVTVEHDAQCRSHSDPAYRKFHLKSMFRFFVSQPFIKLKSSRLMEMGKE